MARRGATILSFDAAPVSPVRYEDLEHLTSAKPFPANPNSFLRHLQIGAGIGRPTGGSSWLCE